MRRHLSFVVLTVLVLILATVSGYVVLTGAAGPGFWDDVIFIASVGVFLILILGKVCEHIAASIEMHKDEERHNN